MSKYTYYLQSGFTLLKGASNWLDAGLVLAGLSKPQGMILQLRNGLSFSVRGQMDIWSVKEAILDKFYEVYGAPVGDGWTIVDIGAGIGEYTLFAAHNHASNRVLAFEPFAESNKLLQENLKMNRITNVEVFPTAVWNQSGELLLDLSGGEPLQLQSAAAELVAADSSKYRRVTSITLADLLLENHIDQVDMIKLDCEGAEYPILFGADDATLGKIRRIVMEYHHNVSRYTYKDMQAFLERKGFKVRVTPNEVHDYLGYLYAWRAE
ncbi:MAG TPA: FkbM family methyltransferase [Anaerolineaceae bacterium]|nr:FkbM family methyltransferase [Anaerolineaceae bacterium]HPN50198.1 FkbM family methyltransferase [Anaerolineaceae bacterium]